MYIYNIYLYSVFVHRLNYNDFICAITTIRHDHEQKKTITTKSEENTRTYNSPHICRNLSIIKYPWNNVQIIECIIDQPLINTRHIIANWLTLVYHLYYSDENKHDRISTLWSIFRHNSLVLLEQLSPFVWTTKSGILITCIWKTHVKRNWAIFASHWCWKVKMPYTYSIATTLKLFYIFRHIFYLSSSFLAFLLFSNTVTFTFEKWMLTLISYQFCDVYTFRSSIKLYMIYVRFWFNDKIRRFYADALIYAIKFGNLVCFFFFSCHFLIKYGTWTKTYAQMKQDNGCVQAFELKRTDKKMKEKERKKSLWFNR